MDLKTINIRKTVQDLTPTVSEFVINNGLDPYPLQSIEKEFWLVRNLFSRVDPDNREPRRSLNCQTPFDICYKYGSPGPFCCRDYSYIEYSSLRAFSARLYLIATEKPYVVINREANRHLTVVPEMSLLLLRLQEQRETGRLRNTRESLLR